MPTANEKLKNIFKKKIPVSEDRLKNLESSQKKSCITNKEAMIQVTVISHHEPLG